MHRERGTKVKICGGESTEGEPNNSNEFISSPQIWPIFFFVLVFYVNEDKYKKSHVMVILINLAF